MQTSLSGSSALRCKIAETLREAMLVRMLRNTCREYLTGYSGWIGALGQIIWHFRKYRQALRAKTYRVYLFYNGEKIPVGYGALALQDERLYVTECVAPDHRGRGFGRVILETLVRIAENEGRDLIAEIWESNVRSIALHTRAGFEFESRSVKSGKGVVTYRLRRPEPLQFMKGAHPRVMRPR